MNLNYRYPKKTFSDGFIEVLRPHYNSNLAKVYIGMWSHNLSFVSKHVTSGTPNNSENKPEKRFVSKKNSKTSLEQTF